MNLKRLRSQTIRNKSFRIVDKEVVDGCDSDVGFDGHCCDDARRHSDGLVGDHGDTGCGAVGRDADNSLGHFDDVPGDVVVQNVRSDADH
ncbi:Hypothetical predicted protein [Octopus vulgaris]|uniref:Uncharacterized protein n=1 Tax=Octopus vulgaris TaxID=6645 RepID=A0AA36BDA0_OCTVU|nr:Hypothetical predicted protein [Octopus vulgaris]